MRGETERVQNAANTNYNIEVEKWRNERKDNDKEVLGQPKKKGRRGSEGEGKKQEVLFQVCFLLSAKPWEKTFMHYAIP